MNDNNKIRILLNDHAKINKYLHFKCLPYFKIIERVNYFISYSHDKFLLLIYLGLSLILGFSTKNERFPYLIILSSAFGRKGIYC